MYQTKTLPIINSIYDMSENQLSDLINMGFCYVKLPREDMTNTAIDQLKEKALIFFRSDQSAKIKFSINEKFEGYVDRQHGKIPQSMQQFFFRPCVPYGPFAEESESINQIKKIFQDEIGLMIIKKILTRFGKEKCFKKLTHQPFSSLAFVYYPKTQEIPCKFGVAAHKDFDLITVLHITKSGLQTYLNNEWVDINPIPGYVVVNIANALELILGKQCHSALHRVLLPREERISMGLFIAPDVGQHFDKPLIDLTTGNILFETYREYLNDQFANHYDEPMPYL